jgi:hypothetical protein
MLSSDTAGTPFRTADQFVNSQIDVVLKKYEKYKKKAIK